MESAIPDEPGSHPVTPGKDGSDRDAITASRLDRVDVPAATGRPLVSPTVVARSRSPALALRLGLAMVAVASAVVGLVLFGDADPALWTYGYWPVRELLSAAIAFSIGGAVLLGYHKARWPVGTLLICGLLAGLALLLAGLWWDALMVAGALAEPLSVTNGIVTDLFLGLSLTVLPQLYPDGPLPGRLWKVLLVVSAGLVVIATLAAQYNFPTIDNLAEWYFWSTVVGLGWLIALVSLIVRWLRGARGALGQVIAIAPEHQTVVAIGSVPTTDLQADVEVVWPLVNEVIVPSLR